MWNWCPVNTYRCCIMLSEWRIMCTKKWRRNEFHRRRRRRLMENYSGICKRFLFFTLRIKFHVQFSRPVYEFLNDLHPLIGSNPPLQGESLLISNCEHIDDALLLDTQNSCLIYGLDEKKITNSKRQKSFSVAWTDWSSPLTNSKINE